MSLLKSQSVKSLRIVYISYPIYGKDDGSKRDPFNEAIQYHQGEIS